MNMSSPALDGPGLHIAPRKRGSPKRRVLIIGLDCLDPVLAFERYADAMPNLAGLCRDGTWGPLWSTVPPITVPAWTCMFASRDPGQLGVYGFRNRKDHGYDRLSYALSSAIKVPRLWGYLTAHGKDSVVLGVPQTYPPRPIQGLMVAGFLTPGEDSDYTHPPELKAELHAAAGDGGYVIDVKDFRTEDKARLLGDVYEMTRRRFRVVKSWVRTKPWDLFAFVEMGPDRLHHGFWRFQSPTHRLYEPGNPFESAIRDYYAYLDGELGELLDLVGDDTAVLVVSDHGARDMVGGICINEWLIERGDLVLKERPAAETRLTPDLVDWSRTRAWGEGGYYGRLFLNVRGREPEGQVAPQDYERVCAELKADLEAICDPAGRNIGTRAFRPHEIYRAVRGVPPDLMVLFGNLAWRSVGSVGLGAIHAFRNDTGPDDANHAMEGVFVLRDGRPARGRAEGLAIYDVAPTVLDRLGLPVPEEMIGQVVA